MYRAQHCSCLSIPETSPSSFSSSSALQLLQHGLHLSEFAHQLPTAWKGSVCPAHTCTSDPSSLLTQHSVQFWETLSSLQSPSAPAGSSWTSCRHQDFGGSDTSAFPLGLREKDKPRGRQAAKGLHWKNRSTSFYFCCCC